jgi:hypothetical protein
MRRTLHIITAALGLLGCFSSLARGQEADLLPALLALDHLPATRNMVATPTTGMTPASPAPVTVGPLEPTVQASTSAPPAAGSIHWVTPEQAAASPLPDWWHATPADIRTCPPCMKAEGLFADPRIIKASRQFDCVRVRTFGAETPGYPSDLFTPHGYRPRVDRYKRFVAGAPTTAYGYVQRFREALKAIGD